MEFNWVKLQAYIVQAATILEPVPEIQKNILRMKSMLCRRLKKLAILPKRELTLGLVEGTLKILMCLQENLLCTNFLL